MATGDKKRRRRKGTPATSPAEDSAKAAPAAAAAAASTPSKASAKKDGGASPEGTSGDGPVGEGGVTAVFGEVLQGEKSLEALFSDDWSGMQANTGMVKSKVGATPRGHGRDGGELVKSQLVDTALAGAWG